MSGKERGGDHVVAAVHQAAAVTGEDAASGAAAMAEEVAATGAEDATREAAAASGEADATREIPETGAVAIAATETEAVAANGTSAVAATEAATATEEVAATEAEAIASTGTEAVAVTGTIELERVEEEQRLKLLRRQLIVSYERKRQRKHEEAADREISAEKGGGDAVAATGAVAVAVSDEVVVIREISATEAATVAATEAAKSETEEKLARALIQLERAEEEKRLLESNFDMQKWMLKEVAKREKAQAVQCEQPKKTSASFWWQLATASNDRPERIQKETARSSADVATLERFTENLEEMRGVIQENTQIKMEKDALEWEAEKTKKEYEQRLGMMARECERFKKAAAEAEKKNAGLSSSEALLKGKMTEKVKRLTSECEEQKKRVEVLLKEMAKQNPAAQSNGKSAQHNSLPVEYYERRLNASKNEKLSLEAEVARLKKALAQKDQLLQRTTPTPEGEKAAEKGEASKRVVNVIVADVPEKKRARITPPSPSPPPSSNNQRLQSGLYPGTH